MEKVKNVIKQHRSPSQSESPRVAALHRSDRRAALGPTCAAHLAVQMEAHVLAPHFMDVICPSVGKAPVHLSVPGSASAHGVPRSGHPARKVSALESPVRASS